MLRGPRWVRTTRGFYRRATDEELTSTQRILDAAALLPHGAVIGGWAAAYAHGVDWLDGRDHHTLAPQPVPVLLAPPMSRRSSPAVRYVQLARAVPSVATIDGIPFTRERRTAMDLARWAADLAEAVVALDALLGARILRADVLRKGRVAAPGSRGIAQATRAVELCRPGVRSPWESRLRMLWVLELRLPSPLVNPPVFDLAGNFLGAPDLLDEEAGLAIEYDGVAWASTTTPDGHRDAGRHREDNAREEQLERAGLIVVRADHQDMMRHRCRLAERLTSARSDGLSRNRRRDRWTLEPPAGWLGMPA